MLLSKSLDTKTEIATTMANLRDGGIQLCNLGFAERNTRRREHAHYAFARRHNIQMVDTERRETARPCPAKARTSQESEIARTVASAAAVAQLCRAALPLAEHLRKHHRQQSLR